MAAPGFARAPMRVTPVDAPQAEVHLMRAAAESQRDSVRGVIEQLEPLDWSRPTFAGADRAAFLLAEAYARSGALGRLIAFGARIESWPAQTDATRWVVQRARLAAIEQGAPISAPHAVGASATDALAASSLLRSGDAAGALALVEATGDVSALALAVRAQALARLGRDDRPALEALTTADTLTPFGRDLGDAARITLATRALEAGQDPSSLWHGTRPDGRLAARASHLEGLWLLEQGQRDTARTLLERALASAPDPTESRAVLRALGGAALENGDWSGAHARFSAADSSWVTQWEALGWLEARDGEGAPWQAWSGAETGSGAAWIPGESEDAAWAARRGAATDLRQEFQPGSPAPSTASSPVGDLPVALPPTAEEWQRLGAARAAAREAEHALARSRWALDRERVSLAQLRNYLELGLGDARAQERSLTVNLARLDSLAATLSDLDARLRALRDAATARVLLRAARVRERVAAQQLWLAGMRHLRLGGPDSARMAWAPAPHAGAPNVLEGEAHLAAHLDSVAARIASDSPARIAASYERAWKPGLIDGVLAQQAIARAALAWARRLEATLDSSRTAASSSALERALRAELPAREQDVDRTAAARLATERSVVLAAVQRTRAVLEQEREGVDYGLAAAAYGASVRLAGAPVADAAVRRSTRDSSTVSELDAALDDPESAMWRATGIKAMRTFLERHPQSGARGEIRFRLADLEMVAARQRFREAMAAHLAQPTEARRGALPVLDHASSLSLYRAILREDRDFEHTDATLFNAAMILSDAGDDEARTLFETLVAQHPQSAYRQESQLRLGDMAFANGDLLGSVPLYEAAAAGNDRTLEVMARYKLGWAHFNEDRFDAAAAAFGSVLDAYAAHPEVAQQADLAAESESYLVHALAGGGGAEAFTRHFAGTGSRPYELRVLLALGQHFRRYGELQRAAEVDVACMQRYPESAEALTSAMRLVQTHERAGHADRARAARLEAAPRFAPGSAWAASQQSDSLRAEGAGFARSAWLQVAQQHHRAARDRGERADWLAARDQYATLLRVWPHDSAASVLHLHLGEAEAKLGDPVAALSHYRSAEEDAPDSVQAQSRWQQVAVTDAWYERTRGTAMRGSDSLARAVREAAATMIAKHPAHAGVADLRWRRAQLAMAHGWHEDAIGDLAELVQQHPGDRRAPDAGVQRAEALFALGRFDAAGAAFEEARALAVAARRDTLARRAADAVPVSWHRFAEASVAADSNAHQRHAERFARVAHEWPEYPQAHTALYRAGLEYLAAGRTAEGVRELERLTARHPATEQAREARLQIPRAWEDAGQKGLASDGFLAFAKRHPDDSGAADAWLHAADLRAAIGDSARADSLRLAYLAEHPQDTETAMAVYEALARRELLRVDAAHPVSQLLASGPASKGARPAPRSRLAQYLALARQHPERTARDLVAQVRFLQGEEAMTAFEAVRLTLPLKRSLAQRQARLDTVLARYRRAADMGVPVWSQAAACRIGEALAGFGKALEQSERPADLKGDDRLAYEEVLAGRAQTFHVRAQGVWSDLLRASAKSAADEPWVVRARTALWRGLGTRFLYQPEVEFPVVGLRRTPRAAADEAASSLQVREDR